MFAGAQTPEEGVSCEPPTWVLGNEWGPFQEHLVPRNCGAICADKLRIGIGTYYLQLPGTDGFIITPALTHCPPAPLSAVIRNIRLYH